MLDAAGILTARGGMTSHAAVVARGMGKCCVSGAGELQIDYKARTIQVNGFTVKEGDWISLNGSTGEVYLGQVATQAAAVFLQLGAQLLGLAQHAARVVQEGVARRRQAHAACLAVQQRQAGQRAHQGAGQGAFLGGAHEQAQVGQVELQAALLG